MTFEPGMQQPPRPAAPPPLFGLLAQAFRQNLEGTVTIPLPGMEAASLVVVGARVVQVSHPDTSSSAVLGALQRAGLFSDRDLPRIEKAARKAAIPMDEGAVAAGAVSTGTLASVREALCRETTIAMLLDRSLRPTAAWAPVRGVRESCALPLPFLLREAQKRHQEIPNIRRVVSGPEAVFGRTSAMRPDAEERWEDLKVAAGERQVYFFVDGRRTVAELALATCQSEFEVSRALSSLTEAGLVRAITSADSTPASSRASRSALRRLAALLVAVVVLVGGIAWGSWTGRIAPSPSLEDATRDPYRTILRNTSQRRLLGAIRQYRLGFNRPPGSFQELVEEHLVLPGDERAATILGLDVGGTTKGAP
jgi:hypothetical protein